MCSPAEHGVAINVVSSHLSGSADQTLSDFGFDFHNDGCHSTLVSALGLFLQKVPQVTRVSSMGPPPECNRQLVALKAIDVASPRFAP